MPMPKGLVQQIALLSSGVEASQIPGLPTYFVPMVEQQTLTFLVPWLLLQRMSPEVSFVLVAHHVQPLD